MKIDKYVYFSWLLDKICGFFSQFFFKLQGFLKIFDKICGFLAIFWQNVLFWDLQKKFEVVPRFIGKTCNYYRNFWWIFQMFLLFSNEICCFLVEFKVFIKIFFFKRILKISFDEVCFFIRYFFGQNVCFFFFFSKANFSGFTMIFWQILWLFQVCVKFAYFTWFFDEICSFMAIFLKKITVLSPFFDKNCGFILIFLRN